MRRDAAKRQEMARALAHARVSGQLPKGMRSMRYVSFVFALCVVVASAAGLFAPQLAQAEECAVMYEHARFEGQSAPVDAGENVDWVGDEWNDMISSFKVGSGCSLTVYEHSKYEGASKTYTSSSNFVGDDWNDQISSFTCSCGEKACGAIYEHANYEGQVHKIKDGEAVGWIGDAWNDMVSSIKVKSGCSITLYEHANYEGASETYGRDSAFVGDGWNDQASGYTCTCGGR